MSTVNYAIEIFTGSTVTRATVPIDGGVIRMITGRPGYDGSITLKDEDDNVMPGVWHEGYLTKGDITNLNRRIDIEITGDYATVSGLRFSRKNTDKFWKIIEDEDINLVNKNARFWAVIDDVFYSLYTCVVSSLARGEITFDFTCSSDHTKRHSYIPRRSITQTSAPDAGDQATYVPIVFGDTPYSPLINVSGDPKRIQTGSIAGEPVYSVGVTSYEVTPAGNTTIQIRVPSPAIFETQFLASKMGDYFLRLVRGKGVPKDMLYQIINSLRVGTSDLYQLTLSEPIKTEGDSYEPDPGVYYPTVTGNPNQDTWFAEVYEAALKYTVSDNAVNSIILDASGRPIIYTLDSDDKIINVSGLTRPGEIDVQSNFIYIVTPSMTLDGEVILRQFFRPDKVLWDPQAILPAVDEDLDDFLNGAFSPFDITDFVTNRSRGIRASYGSTLGGGGASPVTTVVMPIWILPPRSLISADPKYVKILLDISSRFTLFDDPVGVNGVLGIFSGDLVDPFNKNILGSKIFVEFNDGKRYIDYDFAQDLNVFAPGAKISLVTLKPGRFEAFHEFCMIPDIYFSNGGNKDLLESDYSKLYTIQIPYYEPNRRVPSLDLAAHDDVINDLDKDTLPPYFRINAVNRYWAYPNFPDSLAVATSITELMEVAIEAGIPVNIFGGDLYARVSGETVDIDGTPTPTNTVYGAVRHILESYDGIMDVDYNNLPDTRSDWHVGRTITERKVSHEYLKEICQQSMVALYVDRKGILNTKAWKEGKNIVRSYDQTNIIRGSIKKFYPVAISKLFNDFDIRYSKNEATGKYERGLIVTRTNEDSFPAQGLLDDNGYPVWWLYVGGLPGSTVNPNLSYGDAKHLWDRAHDLYEKTSVVRKLPLAFSELSWFIDTVIFDETNQTGTSTASSAYKFLKNTLEWVTTEKQYVDFSLPVNSDTIKAELLDYVSFSDPVYTDNVAYGGWITKLDLSPEDGEMEITVLLDPMIDFGDIVETGSASVLVNETGSQDNLIIEG